MEAICKCGECRTLMIVGTEGKYIGYSYDNVPIGIKVCCISCNRKWKKVI